MRSARSQTFPDIDPVNGGRNAGAAGYGLAPCRPKQPRRTERLRLGRPPLNAQPVVPAAPSGSQQRQRKKKSQEQGDGQDNAPSGIEAAAVRVRERSGAEACSVRALLM
jgi:hypothetical protein